MRSILTQYNFVKRLALLLAADIALTIVYSYVPADWTMTRSALAVIEFGFMAATMWVALIQVIVSF